MNIKQLVGVAVAVVGIFLIGYGAYSKSHVSRAASEIHKMSQSKNAIVKSAGKEMEIKVGNYSHKVKWSFLAGLILIVVGGGAAYFFRKHHR